MLEKEEKSKNGVVLVNENGDGSENETLDEFSKFDDDIQWARRIPVDNVSKNNNDNNIDTEEKLKTKVHEWAPLSKHMDVLVFFCFLLKDLLISV